MNVIHITNSYTLSDKRGQEIYHAVFSVVDYKSFFHTIRTKKFHILHIHAVKKELFTVYACIARACGLKVVVTLHTPTVFSYGYIVHRLCTRFLYNHTICTSKYIMEHVHKYHLSSRHARSLVYEGVDHKKIDQLPTKDAARSYIYQRLGISFTKNVRLVGTIVDSDMYNGLEHLVDAAYLADMYKNLTNTVFVILARKSISEEVRTQIQELGVEGLCFVVEYVNNPEEYLRAFDIYVSPRTAIGDLYVLLAALYVDVPCIATKVSDTREFEPYVPVPLVPPGSAKYLTEALMYVIKREKPVVFKAGIISSSLPKRFTKEHEKQMLREIYENLSKK